MAHVGPELHDVNPSGGFTGEAVVDDIPSKWTILPCAPHSYLMKVDIRERHVL